jgi:biotin-dependent carboxylase-like uncharacterized protein
MALEIINSGFMALIQDYGRYGYHNLGVSSGGPLDEHAYLWANRLLLNTFNAPCLEVTVGGFSARFTKNTMISLCGADLSATLNDRNIHPWQTYFVETGDELRLSSPRKGLRAYLAVKGGFQIDQQLGSCATVIRENIGGLNQDGKKLADKERIAYEASDEIIHRHVPQKYIPEYLSLIELRFFPNYSVVGAGEIAIESFSKFTYEVSQGIDRMGYRLQGPKLTPDRKGITSQGISVGAIQLPQDGQPIVLMKDKQTMGGYPLLGNLTYLDIAKLAQAMPGTKVKFFPVSIGAMEKELLIYKRFFGLAL